MFNTCNLANALTIYVSEAKNGFDIRKTDMYKLFIACMLDEIKQGELSMLFTDSDWEKISRLQSMIMG